jgi:hypothetical protein
LSDCCTGRFWAPPTCAVRRIQDGLSGPVQIKEEEKTLYANMTPDEIEEVIIFHTSYTEYQEMMEALLG